MWPASANWLHTSLQSVHLSSVLLFSHESGSGAECWSDSSTAAGTASCTARSSEAASAPPAAAAGWVLSANKDSLQPVAAHAAASVPWDWLSLTMQPCSEQTSPWSSQSAGLLHC
jgi:hypothetical protein